MQKIFGYIQGQRVDLSVHEKNERGLRNEAAMRFTAAMLQNPSCPLSKERLIEVAIECADELCRQLKKN
jgi:hypothetical protein